MTNMMNGAVAIYGGVGVMEIYQPLFSKYPFVTEKGLPLKYTVRGGEIFFNRKEKSVTKATVMKAFRQARQIQAEKGFVNGPKELGTFGASYLYPVFLRIGVCKKSPDKK